MRKRCLVFLTGAIPPDAIRENDVTICADSGAIPLIEEGLIPDHLIGDMDSLDESIVVDLEDKGTDVIRYPQDKDMTDGELSVRFALSLDPGSIEIFGGRSGRTDHIFSSLLLLHIIPEHIEKVFHLGNDDIYLVREGSRRTFGDVAEVISMIPAGSGTVISIEGCRYDVDRISIPVGSTRCIHNEIHKDEFTVNVHSGSVYVILAETR